MLAAKNSERNSIGVETEEYYCNYIIQRLEADRTLFDEYTVEYFNLSQEMDTYNA